jgi:hypothetical protein
MLRIGHPNSGASLRGRDTGFVERQMADPETINLGPNERVIVKACDVKALDARVWGALIICFALAVIGGEMLAYFCLVKQLFALPKADLSSIDKLKSLLPTSQIGFYVLLVGVALMMIGQLIVSWSTKPTIIVNSTKDEAREQPTKLP